MNQINFNDLPTEIHNTIFVINRNDATIRRQHKEHKVKAAILTEMKEDAICEVGFF